MTMHQSSPRRPAQGRSLIELMVAILIGSLVLAGVMVITAGSSSIGRRTDSLGGLTDNGQIAAQLLASDVRMAGYSMPRTYFSAGYVTKMRSTAGIRGCDNGFVDYSVDGLGSLTCAPDATSKGGAVSIAYEADPYNAIYVTSDSGTTPGDCRGFGLVPVAGSTKGNMNRPEAGQDSMSDTPVYWQVENRYFIANSGPDNEPSLVCAGNGGEGKTKYGVQPLIRGVERMVVTYGVAAAAASARLDSVKSSGNVLTIDDPSVTFYMNSDAIDKKWPGELADVRWQRVVSVRLCLETRGAVGSAATGAAALAEGSSYINCDGTSKTITDGRARRAVRMTINLRNRTMNVDSNFGLGLGGV